MADSDVKHPPQKRFKRHSLAAIAEIDRLAINPLEMMLEVYRTAMDGYKSGRGISDKGDNGAAWLSVARAAADNLASYRYPKLSAIAVKDVDKESNDAKPLTTKEAIAVLKSDPFSFEPGSTIEVIDQMASGTQTPHLVKGKGNGSNE